MESGGGGDNGEERSTTRALTVRGTKPAVPTRSHKPLPSIQQADHLYTVELHGAKKNLTLPTSSTPVLSSNWQDGDDGVGRGDPRPLKGRYRPFPTRLPDSHQQCNEPAAQKPQNRRNAKKSRTFPTPSILVLSSNWRDGGRGSDSGDGRDGRGGSRPLKGRYRPSPTQLHDFYQHGNEPAAQRPRKRRGFAKRNGRSPPHARSSSLPTGEMVAGEVTAAKAAVAGGGPLRRRQRHCRDVWRGPDDPAPSPVIGAWIYRPKPRGVGVK